MSKQHTLVKKICIHIGSIRPMVVYAWAIIGKLLCVFCSCSQFSVN